MTEASCNHHQLSPADDLRMAREAIAAGDLRHAAHHVAGVLAHDPNAPDHLEAWTSLASAAGAQLPALFASEGALWFGRAACLARADYERGSVDDAFVLLCEVARAAPDVAYMDWTQDWALPSERGLRTATSKLLTVYDGGLWQRVMRGFGERAAAAFPLDETLLTRLSIGARRAGQLLRAVELAEQSLRATATWFGEITLANAYREVGDVEKMEAAWSRAIELDPSDHCALLDWGDSLVQRGELRAARDKYMQALARHPEQAWATGSLWYLDYLETPTMRSRQQLAARVRTHPENARARQALASVTPWLGYLPDPSDATASTLAQLGAQDLAGVKMAVTHLEGASVLHAAHSMLPGLTRTAGRIPSPDPRTPLGSPRWPLYTWNDLHPEPALPPPRADVAARLEPLLETPYESDAWSHVARDIAGRITPEDVPQLLPLTVHPLHGSQPLYLQLWRQQHAVAFVLAALLGDSPSEQQPPLAGLRSMLAVRNDWAAIAALAALTALGETDASVRRIALNLAMDVLQEPPDEGSWETGPPAWLVLLRLDPDDSLGLHERAFQWFDDRDAH